MRKTSIICVLLIIQMGLYAAAPIGNVDAVNKDQVWGWAKDADWSGPIDVHVYCYPRGSSSPLWGVAITANVWRSDVGYHGFNLTHPNYTALAEGEYDIVAYAIGKNSAGQNDGQNIALSLSLVGSEQPAWKQTIRKDFFANGQYLVFSQYLGIMWDEASNYDMYQSAVRTSNNGTVYCYYTKMESGGGETIYVRTSPNGITGWSAATKVINRGPGPDSVFIADPDVLAVQEGGDYRFWLHYTGYDGVWNYVFQATTTASQYTSFVKRDRNGNVSTAIPMMYPSHNYPYSTYGAGQPSMLIDANNTYWLYFTDTSCENPPSSQVVRFSGATPMSFFDIGVSQYYSNRMAPPVNYLNTAHWTYYPNLATYATVLAYTDITIYVGPSTISFNGDYGRMIYDKGNVNRNYIAEGGLLRGLKGHITTPDNSTIVYYGAGKDTGDWSRYSTTGCGATRFYLYKLY